MSTFWQQIKMIDRLVLEKYSAYIPGHALLNDFVTAAQPVKNLQCALGIAECARARGQAVIIIQNNDPDALTRQIYRCGQTYRPGTHNHHRMMRRLSEREISAALILKLQGLVIRCHSE